MENNGVTGSPFHRLGVSFDARFHSFPVFVANNWRKVMSVLAWILYDISADRRRNKVAKACKQYGLIRVQKSAFLGKLERNRFDELAEACLSLIDEETDSVYLFPFCQEDFRAVKVLGQGFDRELVNDEMLARFF